MLSFNNNLRIKFLNTYKSNFMNYKYLKETYNGNFQFILKNLRNYHTGICNVNNFYTTQCRNFIMKRWCISICYTKSNFCSGQILFNSVNYLRTIHYSVHNNNKGSDKKNVNFSTVNNKNNINTQDLDIISKTISKKKYKLNITFRNSKDKFLIFRKNYLKKCLNMKHLCLQRLSILGNIPLLLWNNIDIKFSSAQKRNIWKKLWNLRIGHSKKKYHWYTIYKLFQKKKWLLRKFLFQVTKKKKFSLKKKTLRQSLLSSPITSAGYIRLFCRWTPMAMNFIRSLGFKVGYTWMANLSRRSNEQLDYSITDNRRFRVERWFFPAPAIWVKFKKSLGCVKITKRRNKKHLMARTLVLLNEARTLKSLSLDFLFFGHALPIRPANRLDNPTLLSDEVANWLQVPYESVFKNLYYRSFRKSSTWKKFRNAARKNFYFNFYNIRFTSFPSFFNGSTTIFDGRRLVSSFYGFFMIKLLELSNFFVEKNLEELIKNLNFLSLINIYAIRVYLQKKEFKEAKLQAKIFQKIWNSNELDNVQLDSSLYLIQSSKLKLNVFNRSHRFVWYREKKRNKIHLVYSHYLISRLRKSALSYCSFIDFVGDLSFWQNIKVNYLVWKYYLGFQIYKQPNKKRKQNIFFKIKGLKSLFIHKKTKKWRIQSLFEGSWNYVRDWYFRLVWENVKKRKKVKKVKEKYLRNPTQFSKIFKKEKMNFYLKNFVYNNKFERLGNNQNRLKKRRFKRNRFKFSSYNIWFRRKNEPEIQSWVRKFSKKNFLKFNPLKNVARYFRFRDMRFKKASLISQWKQQPKKRLSRKKMQYIWWKTNGGYFLTQRFAIKMWVECFYAVVFKKFGRAIKNILRKQCTTTASISHTARYNYYSNTTVYVGLHTFRFLTSSIIVNYMCLQLTNDDMLSFVAVLKQAMRVVRFGFGDSVLGLQFIVSGRMTGAERASYSVHDFPQYIFRPGNSHAYVDFAVQTFLSRFGISSIKMWLYRRTEFFLRAAWFTNTNHDLYTKPIKLKTSNYKVQQKMLLF